MNPDKPLIRRGGQTEDVEIHNRIAAIKRIEYLAGGVNLSQKTHGYLRALDMEMWYRWYKDRVPFVQPIADEDFCQKAADVIKAMEGGTVADSIDEETYNAALKEYENQRGTQNASEHAEGSSQNVGRADQQK